MSNGKRRVTIVVLLVGAIVFAGAVRDLSRLRGAAPIRNMVDLSVFYCAGASIDAGRNPYDAATIRTCEHRVNEGKTWADPRYAMYAPLPPYDFAPFTLLARVPYPLAKIFMLATIALIVVLTALAMRTMGVPLYAGLAALALSDGFIGSFLGQLYPFTIACVALSAAALKRGRDGWVGVAAAATLMQPPIGLFVCLALFVWAPRARLALLMSGAVLMAIGDRTMGASSFVDWVTRAVTTQAAGEVHAWTQYSLTAILGQFDLPARMTMLAGAISTLVMLVAALYLARTISGTPLGRPAIALVPAACSVIGGTYVHLGAIAVATLAASWIVASDPRRSVAPLALLSVPWPFVQDIKALFACATLVVGIVIFGLRGFTKTGIVLLAIVVAAMYALELHPPADVAVGLGAGVGQAIETWRIVGKLPTFFALFALLYQFVRVSQANDVAKTS